MCCYSALFTALKRRFMTAEGRNEEEEQEEEEEEEEEEEGRRRGRKRESKSGGRGEVGKRRDF